MFRLAKNQSSIGFINPTLYAAALNYLAPSDLPFNDITSGGNKCCSYQGSTPADAPCCVSGFTAAPGWDPVTGLGSVYFPRFAALFNVTVVYTPNTAPLPFRTFFGVPAVVMALVVLVCLFFAALYPLGAALRRKLLPPTPRASYLDERGRPIKYRDLRRALGAVCDLWGWILPTTEPARGAGGIDLAQHERTDSGGRQVGMAPTLREPFLVTEKYR
jgi:hypothetical protein